MQLLQSEQLVLVSGANSAEGHSSKKEQRPPILSTGQTGVLAGMLFQGIVTAHTPDKLSGSGKAMIAIAQVAATGLGYAINNYVCGSAD